MNLKKIILPLILLVVLLIPLLSKAAIIDTSLINEAANCGEGGCSLNTFVKLGISVANFILGIVGALTLLMFVYGGLMWILSGGSSEKVQKGKDIIIGSVVGLLIVFSSYTIIKFTTENLLGGKFNPTAPADTKTTTKIETNQCSNCKETCDNNTENSTGKKNCPSTKTCCEPKQLNECQKYGGLCVPGGSGGNPCKKTINVSGKNLCLAGSYCCEGGDVGTLNCSDHGVAWECRTSANCPGHCEQKPGTPDCSANNQICCSKLCR